MRTGHLNNYCEYFRHGLSIRSQSVQDLSILVSALFSPLADVYVTMAHDDTGVRAACEQIFKDILTVSGSTRGVAANELHRALVRDDAVRWIPDKMARCVAENMFNLLHNFATHDRRLLRNLSPFIRATVSGVEQQRFGGSRTGKLTELCEKLLKNVG